MKMSTGTGPVLGVSDFVNNEVKQLLKDGIIRPSRSPYNSPNWGISPNLPCGT